MFAKRPLSPQLHGWLAIALIALAAAGSHVTPTTATSSGPAQVAGAVSTPTQAGVQGTPWTGDQGVGETSAEIMARGRRAGQRVPQRPAGGKIEPDRTKLPPDPDSPDVAQWPPRPHVLRLSVSQTSAAQTPTLGFTTATLFTDSTYKPPDTMGAVGPTEFLTVINGRVKSIDKQTGATGALNTSLDNFFTATRGASGAFDPRVRFDRLTGRWFIIAVNGALAPPNRVLIAVSDGPAISSATVWTHFFFQQDLAPPAGESACWGDYPTLGIDANAVYVGVNQFCPSYFGGSTLFVVRKTSVLGGGPIVVTAFRDLITATSGPVSPHGADNDDPTASAGYVVGVDYYYLGRLTLRRVIDPGGTPSITGNMVLTVPGTRTPINVPQASTAAALHGGDGRLMMALIRNDRLWTTHASGVDNGGTTSGTITRNAARWYEIDNLDGAAPTLAQSGTLFTPTGTNSTDARHFFYPSLMVSGQGHMAIGASSAGQAEFANGVTAGRLAGDAPGTLRTPVLFTSSASTYARPDSQGRNRWGDYSYTSLDPADNMTIWTIQEYVSATDIWSVRVAKLVAPPPPTPAAASPATVPQGQGSVNIVVTGSSVSGSGFYDPGPGFAGRLAASATGGVTVNSVSFTSPTRVTVNLSTAGATIGPKDLTIVNPDGQRVTAVGLFAVTGSATDTVAPVVSVIAPNGGDILHAATPYTITWTGSDNVAVTGYDVEFAPNGTTYSAVPGCTGLSGAVTTCAWSAPGPQTTNGRVRVVARDAAGNSAADQSNNTFEVAAGAAAITVKAPNTLNTNWGIGATQSVTWTHNTGAGELVNLDVSRDGGASWTAIASGVPNTSAGAGKYGWTVTGPASSGARIRVSAVHQPIADASNASFTIAPPSVILTSPVGASTNWGYETKQKATWTTNLGSADQVRVRLSTDGGASFPVVLAAAVAATKKSATFTVPALAAPATARVRVEWLTNGSVQGTSAANFQVAPAFVTVAGPNVSSDQWSVGQQGAVTWVHNLGALESVKIDVSTDGGATYPFAFSGGTKSDGAQAAAVAAAWASTNARIRVSWKKKPAVADASNQSFRIQ